MNIATLPHFYSILSQKFQGFDPYLSGWEDVELSRLNEIEKFLEDKLEDFQTLVLQDKVSGYPGSEFVCNICRTLKTFLSWSESFPIDYLNPQDDESKKETVVRKICLSIGFKWLPWLSSDYEPLRKETQKIPEILPVEDRPNQIKLQQQERLDNELRENLFSCIVGNTTEEKKHVFETIKYFVSGKGGKKLAPYLKAAMNLNLLTALPKFTAMERFWNITMSQPALSRYLSATDCSIDEIEVSNKTNEIKTKLAGNA